MIFFLLFSMYFSIDQKVNSILNIYICSTFTLSKENDIKDEKKLVIDYFGFKDLNKK